MKNNIKTSKWSKRTREIREKIESTRQYSFAEAVELLKTVTPCKFEEKVDVSIKLGVDPKKSDQVVRGATTLPNGTGRSVRVAVFADGDLAKQATEAGADIVGTDDLAEAIKSGEINFDVLIATPAAMKVVGALGQILGPKGLMPNPKLGTVTQDVATAVQNTKKGQARYRTDKAGIIHASIGSISFAVDALKENLDAVIADLKKLKPDSSKGVYLKKVDLTTTMGPGLTLDISAL